MKPAWVLALVVALVLVAPPAAAQTPPDVQLEVSGTEDPFVPDGNATVLLDVDYNCVKVDPVEGTPMTIRRPGPAWLGLIGPSEVTLEADAQQCTRKDGREQTMLFYDAEVAAGALAYEAEDQTFNVTIAYPDANSSAEVTTPVSLAYVPNLQMSVDRSASSVYVDETARHTLTVQNLGNGPVRVVVEVERSDPGLQLDLPAPATVPSHLTGESTWTGEIGISGTLPADEAERTFEATLNVSAAYAGSEDNTTVSRSIALQAAISKRPEDVDEGQPTPGFGAAPLLVAAAAAAVVLARRREGF